MDCAHLKVESLMPHRGRMRVVRNAPRSGRWHGPHVYSSARRLSLRGGRWHAKTLLAVELVAQSVACYVGWAWLSKPEKPGSFGYVVAVDNLQVEEGIALCVGDTLEVRVTREFELPPAGVFRGEVRLRERPHRLRHAEDVHRKWPGLYGRQKRWHASASYHGR